MQHMSRNLKFNLVSLLLPTLLAAFISVTRSENLDIWAWKCVEKFEASECIKARKTQSDISHISLRKCKLTCGKYGSLFPRPQDVSLSNETVSFLPSGILWDNKSICAPRLCPMLQDALGIMNFTVHKHSPININGKWWLGPWPSEIYSQKVFVQFNVPGEDEYLSLSSNESYNLAITTEGSQILVVISAPTFFGARHGLETLSQLIDYDDENNSLQIVSPVVIQDSPAFGYRGLIVDTSRNFISIEKIKKIFDAMSYNKLNTFHWHITDSHSFPLFLNSLPNMATYGAYDKRKTYSPSDVRDLVLYGRIRGIRVLPEIDAPAHVGHGWQWGEEMGLGKLVVCLDAQPWTSYCVEPPCGQMNLANEKLYNVLSTLYNEVIDMFSPVDLFHYGGDEVNLNCWNTSSEMVDWMQANSFGLTENSYYQQWSIFQEKARNLVQAANKGKEPMGIIWTSKLTEKGHVEKYLNKNHYVIQIWSKGDDPIVKELLEKGYKVIFSNHDSWYLDCGSASWVGKGTNWCSPYKGWQDVYDNDIESITRKVTGSDAYFKQILGGEAALWTEQVDDSTVETKLWPRGAALGERLWTNPSSDYRAAEHRMLQHRERMLERGILVDRLQPEWCRQNQGQCPI